MAKKAAPKKAATSTKKTVEKKQSVRKLLSKRLAQASSSEPSHAGVLDRLAAVIETRRHADPEISHSARLLSRGTAKVAQKFGEEAVECLIEAVAGNRTALIAESADVLYHLLLLWADAGVKTGDVWAELERREGISGIAEKASRALPARVTMTAKIP
jgi:phosphoribosyl-ATP pyrophosphohydrolase